MLRLHSVKMHYIFLKLLLVCVVVFKRVAGWMVVGGGAGGFGVGGRGGYVGIEF